MSVVISRLVTRVILKKVLQVWKPHTTFSTVTNIWYSRSLLIQQHFKQQSSYCTRVEDDNPEEDKLYDILSQEYLDQASVSHQIFVIQPHIKSGPRRFSKDTDLELKLEESCALVKTLPNWKVIEKRIVIVRNPEIKLFFTSGHFEDLKQVIRKNQKITAVFISVDYLNASQVVQIQKAWKIPVFDRYTVVLQIFREHARTREAQLQIALAEIPYIRNKLKLLEESVHLDKQSGAASYISGGGETMIAVKKRVLKVREMKLKGLLEKVDTHCTMLRSSRQRKKIPVVAVVGYTNSGKTTLIKVLTKDEKMEPKNQLFATLDVTAHGGTLPNGMHVLYIDTVGFIADMPTRLINAFNVTLRDALEADLILHVRDISHPDTEAQRKTVIETLQKMLSEDVDNIVEVCNKTDLIESKDINTSDEDNLYISAVSGLGLDNLQQQISEKLMKFTDQLQKKVKIPTDGDELNWLHKEAAVQSVELYDDNHFIVDIIIETSKYEQFKKIFGKKQPR